MITETFELDHSPDIDVRIESGRVEVSEGPPGSVEVTVDTEDPGFIVERRGNTILVSSNKSQSWLSRGSSYVNILTPPGSDLAVAVASARVECTVPLGKVDAKTASGDVDLDRVTIATVKTASGDVTIEGVDQAIRFTSASGDLFIHESCRGSAGISTASGDVRIGLCEADLAVNTVSGDVLVSRFSGRSGSFKAMSGDVDLAIPTGSSVDLDVNLLSGRLDLPKAEPDRAPPERHIAIKAKLVSGDFTIHRV